MLAGETVLRETFDTGQVVPLSAYSPLDTPSPSFHQGRGFHHTPSCSFSNSPTLQNPFTNPAYPAYPNLHLDPAPSPLPDNPYGDHQSIHSSMGSRAPPLWPNLSQVHSKGFYSEPISARKHVEPPGALVHDKPRAHPSESTGSCYSAHYDTQPSTPREQYPAERYHLGQVRVPLVHEAPVYENHKPMYLPYAISGHSTNPATDGYVSTADSGKSISFGSEGLAQLQRQLSAASTEWVPPGSNCHEEGKVPVRRSLDERRVGGGGGLKPASARRSLDSMAIEKSGGMSLRDELAMMESEGERGGEGVCGGVPCSPISKGPGGSRSFPGPQGYQSGRRQEASEQLTLSAATAQCRMFSEQSLAEATGNWDPKNALGKGRFGTVFLGRISGCQVAVKRLESTSKHSAKEYHSEVEVLSRVRHPHIILLMGHCPEASCLVYEFMPRGSLQDYLGGRTNASVKTPLHWPQRVQALADVASALLCLHHFSPPIVHRDLKPQNIMVDSSMRAKVGDAGLARLLEDEDDSITCRVSGTFGYIDPEMMTTLEVTPANDIYAFGIICLQLLTGEEQVSKIHKLINETTAAFPEKLVPTKIVEALMDRLDATAGKWPSDVARHLARLGLRCARRRSRDRPDLEVEVLPALSDILEHLVVGRSNGECADAAVAEADVEDQFHCPLSKQLMVDPVLAADGFTYERKSIEAWQVNRAWSPVTGQPFAHRGLTPNNSLKMLLGKTRAAYS